MEKLYRNVKTFFSFLGMTFPFYKVLFPYILCRVVFTRIIEISNNYIQTKEGNDPFPDDNSPQQITNNALPNIADPKHLLSV